MSLSPVTEPYPIENVHRLLEPGPVIMVSTRGRDGRPNLMTNGFNMPIEHGGLIALVLGPWDYSYAALQATHECVIAVPSIDLAESVVGVGNCSGAEVDKWARFGFTQAPASVVGAPLVEECFANIECRVADTGMVAQYNLWLLRPVAAWLDPAMRHETEFHHRGDGTFSPNGDMLDLKHLMSKWQYLTS